MSKRFTLKNTAGGAALSKARQPRASTRPSPKTSRELVQDRSTVLVGAHYLPDVRRVLKIIEAETGRNLKQVLGEAINDLAAKYDKPHPYHGEH